MPFALTDLPSLLEEVPPGNWVAISEEQNKVLSYGADAQAVLEEARVKGEEMPILTRIPEEQTLMCL